MHHAYSFFRVGNVTVWWLKMRIRFVSAFTRRTRVSFTVTALASLLGLAGYAFAGEDVGIAVTVRNDVTGKIQSQTVKVNDGSNVFGREIVRTGPDSSAKIVLKDNTNLNVGPGSSVTLDNFVFNGDSDYKRAGFNLAKGAFRFTSGGSDKRAYDLKTPVGTIGVRGTEFHALVKDGVTHIEVNDGLTKICPVKVSVDSPVVPQQPGDKACHKGCMEVGPGQAVDVTASCIMNAQFTNMSVGQNAVSFAQASAMSGGLTVGTAVIGAAAGAAALGGVLAGTLGNNQTGNNTPQCVSGC